MLGKAQSRGAGFAFAPSCGILFGSSPHHLNKPTSAPVVVDLHCGLACLRTRSDSAEVTVDCPRPRKIVAQLHCALPPITSLMAIEGVGPVTATALVASVGNARTFQSGRQFAAWLGHKAIVLIVGGSHGKRYPRTATG